MQVIGIKPTGTLRAKKQTLIDNIWNCMAGENSKIDKQSALLVLKALFNPSLTIDQSPLQ
jgi:hypothetical protein